MTMSDPLGDMLTRIRNGQQASKEIVEAPFSRLRENVCKVLQDEGYIESFEIKGEAAKPVLHIDLKYYAGRPVIERIDRVSTPSLRIYKGRHDIPEVMNGLGIAIISTPQGVMTDRKARANGVGGEVICYVA